jgi:hypothetical protein
VEKTKTDVLVRIPKDAVPARQLNAFLDWLRLEELTQRSALKEGDADRLAEEVKTEWWAVNKERFIPSKEQ